jgi:hypothetical protein
MRQPSTKSPPVAWTSRPLGHRLYVHTGTRGALGVISGANRIPWLTREVCDSGTLQEALQSAVAEKHTTGGCTAPVLFMWAFAPRDH